MIVATPKYDYNSAYLPFLFELVFNGINMAYAQISVFIDGNFEETKFVAPRSSTNTTTSFTVDLQTSLQLRMGTPQFGISNVFPTFPVTPTQFPYQVVNDNNFKDVRIIVSYYQFQNNIPALAGRDVSQTYKALVGTRQINEPEEYIGFITGSSLQGKFLSRRKFSPTETTPITRSQSLYFSFIADPNINSFQVIALNKQGLPIYNAVGNFLSSAGDIKTLGVGLPQLDYPSWLSGSFDPTDPEIDKYSVVVGNGNFSAFSQFFLFQVVPDCKEGLEVHWLNELGGGESYVFRTETIETLSVKGNFARSPLSADPFDVRKTFEKGRFKFNNADAKIQYTCVSDFLQRDEAEFLKGLLYATEVYAVIDGAFYSLQVEDGDFVIDDNNDFKTQLEVTLTRSVDQYTLIR
ncbi:MAG: hypothetical protein GY827_08390 [Cytophagales bacterium]|nr:hypothetical protein [Cytophagales bacterium]